MHSFKVSENESSKSSLSGLGLEWRDIYRIENIKKEHYYLIVCGGKYIPENVVNENSWSVVEQLIMLIIYFFI